MDRPILFSGPMVRALLDGRKTQTRRILKPQPPTECSIRYMLGNESWLQEADRSPLRYHWEAWGGPLFIARPDGHMCGSFTAKMRYKPGDRLWVREAWDFIPHDEPKPEGSGLADIVYWADAETLELEAPAGFNPMLYGHEKVRPGIHMPRWASRLTLTVTDVRVQRLQDISEDDAKAEGAELDQTLRDIGAEPTYRGGFARIWADIHEPSLESETCWARKPWVAAYTFTVERRNIDEGRVKHADATPNQKVSQP